MKIEEGLTYDDVLMIPQKNSVESRSLVDTSTYITKNVKLNIPMVSIHMATVTEADMAIAMASEGGLGIIHRFMPIEEQVAEVRKVKRTVGMVIEDPLTCYKDICLGDAIELMESNNVTSLFVVDRDNKLIGIFTKRDYSFEKDMDKTVGELMTPKEKLITGKSGIYLEEAKQLLVKNKIEKLPLMNGNDNIVGLVCSKSIKHLEEHKLACRDEKGRLRVGAAVGIKGDYLERAEALFREGVDLLVVDVAHAHSDMTINAVKELKKKFSVDLLVGNVATAEGAKDLVKAGADGIKVGIGNGCFVAGTRILMANGTYKNIERIQSGERIINKEGNPVTVKNSFCMGVKNVSKLRSSIFYGDTYVTPNHNYWIGDLNTSSISTIQSRGYANLLQIQSKTIPKASKYKWKEVDELKRDVLLIPKEINFELKNDFEIVLNKRKGGNWLSEYTYERDYLIKPTYELGYVFGTFLGDGHAHIAEYKGSHIGSVRWYFGKYELDFVNKLSKCINKIFNKKCSIRENEKVFEVIFYYKPLADFLSKFGKRINKHLPSKYLVKHRDYLKGILDGLIDSDGCREDYGRVTFANTSKKLVELFNIVSYLVSGVFPNNEKRKITSGYLKNVNIKNFNECYVSRIITSGDKRLTDDYQISKILDYEKTNLFVPVYDLEVDCPTHSFIANNAIVHNSICTTRLVAGAGVPQLTAVLDVVKECKKKGIPVSNEGGIATAGNFAKAIAAGCNAAIFGSVFAGCEETPGPIVYKGGKRYKHYHGSTSYMANVMKEAREKKKSVKRFLKESYVEGVESLVPYKGSVKNVIESYMKGLRSGATYCGAKNIFEMQKNARFVRITGAGFKESAPHDVREV